MPSDSTIFDAAHRLTRRNGAITVEQLEAAIAAAEEPAKVVDEEIRLVLGSISRIRWLDSEGVWFWVGGRGGNRVLHVVEKVLAVARSIEISSLCEGVRRVPGLGNWSVPDAVVGRLCEESCLCRREGRRLTATPVVRHWTVLLGRSESALVRILRAHGPVLARDELERRATEQPSFDPDGFAACLDHSPIVEEPEPGVFRLRGTGGPAEDGDADAAHAGRRTGAGRQPNPRRSAPAPAGSNHAQTILPRGRHGLPREAVAANQRARLLDGIVAVVAERGYAEATIADAVAAARVSRKTFYELFADKEACFAAACERWLGRLMSETRAAFESRAEATWCERAQRALAALLRGLAADPVAARAFVVEASGAGAAAIARRDIALRELAELIDLGREDGSQRLPGITSHVLIGGLEELVRSRILHGATAQLPALLPDLVFCLTQPLLGTEAATAQRDRARRRLERDERLR